MSGSISQTVAEVLRRAERALTLTEILARTRLLRPVDTAKPEVTIRNALGSLPLVVSLGGRPAHYLWWPHSLAGASFRQPLTNLEPASGQVILHKEVWLALWPTFFAERRATPHDVLFVIADGATLPAQIDFLGAGQGARGFLPNPALADWFRQQGATTNDALLVHVLDVEQQRYRIELERSAARDEATMTTRNQALADAAAEVLREVSDHLADYYLIPRLVARGAYRDPRPPDPLDVVLRGDLGFIVREHSIRLAEKTVNSLERAMEVRPDPHASPRPPGDYRPALLGDDMAMRRAWGEYLFDRGLDHRWVKWNVAAEAYYREALRLDPGHADAWVHLGILRLEENRVEDALACYERGEAAALARTIGDPQMYEGPFWLDMDSRPYMRALHGKGLCLWRLSQTHEARRVFAQMLRLNPNDNQGVRFLIPDLDAGLTWEESMAQDEQARAIDA